MQSTSLCTAQRGREHSSRARTPAFFFVVFFCRYQSYCFPPRELLLLARGGHFFVNCVLFWGSFSRRVMNLLLKQLHESNIWRKTGKKRCCSWETQLRRRRIIQSGFRLWHQAAECWVGNPTIASPSNSGSVTAVCSVVNVSSCPGETVCLTASRSLNPAVTTLFRSLVALISKIWWTLYSFTSQSLNYWLPRCEIIKSCPCAFILTKNWLDWFMARTHFYLRKFQYDSKINQL